MMIGIVTTFSDAGYNEYAHLLVEGLTRFLDPKIKVFVYIDNVNLNLPENFNLISLEKSNPDLVNFKNRHKDKIPSSFMNDAVRFSHKSYAMWHASLNSNVDKLFWLDADTVLQSCIDEKYLEKFLPDDVFTSYLGRPGRYTETGFIGFNLNHICIRNFFKEFINYYNNDKIYTELEYQTDCHVYDAARQYIENTSLAKSLDLTPGLGKSNFNHIHKGYMVHNKGANKTGKKEKKGIRK